MPYTVVTDDWKQEHTTTFETYAPAVQHALRCSRKRSDGKPAYARVTMHDDRGRRVYDCDNTSPFGLGGA